MKQKKTEKRLKVESDRDTVFIEIKNKFDQVVSTSIDLKEMREFINDLAEAYQEAAEWKTTSSKKKKKRSKSS